MKLRILFFLAITLFLASCGSKKRAVNKKNPGVVIVEPKPIDLPSVNQIELTKDLKKKNPRLNKYTLAYIRKYAPIAVKEMHEYKIPASINEERLYCNHTATELSRSHNMYCTMLSHYRYCTISLEVLFYTVSFQVLYYTFSLQVLYCLTTGTVL